MYANSGYTFKRFLINYCKELNITYPNDCNTRAAMRAQYSKAIKENDMVDDSETLMSWLDDTYLKKINEEKNMKDSLTMGDMFKAKAALNKTYAVPTAGSMFVSIGGTATWTEFPTPAPTYDNGIGCCKKKQEKEDTMNYNEIEASRKYLNQRATDTFYTKEQALADQFNTRKSDRPHTYKELIDAIKNGNYELDTKKTAQIDDLVDDEGYYFGSMLDGIKWKLPDGPDRDGFNVAIKAARAALIAAKDVINTQDSAAGLKALQDFEAWTYTAPVVSA